MSIFAFHTQLFLYVHPQGDFQTQNSFNISWLIVRMSYHRFNNLAKLINSDLSIKIGQLILSHDLIDK